MNKSHFVSPVRIQIENGGSVTVIDGVAQALKFLQAWPAHRCGPVHRTAFRACSAALVAQIPPDDAAKCFRNFARLTGILAAEIDTKSVSFEESRTAL